MASTDRAFRALARAQPAVVLALLRAAFEDLLPDARLRVEDVNDPKLDLPPPKEADLVAFAGETEVLHVEGQGYGEREFEARVFQYHLRLVLRYPERRIRTVALWLVQPADAQRLGHIERSGVQIDVQTVVLGEIRASRLLAQVETVCFASGADAEGLSDEALCDAVARALRAQNASWQRRLICAAVAAAAGRYDAMIRAMQQNDLEPPIIEDLVLFGRDRGRSEGIELGRSEGIELGRSEGIELGRSEGIELGRSEGQRSALLELLAARGLSLSAEQRARVDSEHDGERLMRWLRRAAVAASAGDIFSE